jgi:hypothetical protein
MVIVSRRLNIFVNSGAARQEKLLCPGDEIGNRFGRPFHGNVDWHFRLDKKIINTAREDSDALRVFVRKIGRDCAGAFVSRRA